MIEVTHTLANCDRLAAWLEETIRPKLRPDVSNYAKGRLRAWLRTEPPLSANRNEKAGVSVADRVLERLAELIEWRFDFCLVTYSGDEKGIGITPHRDASYANYEARSLHLTGECRFDYWCERPGFDGRKSNIILDAHHHAATQSLLLQPGMVTRFNCKNQHAATPSCGRWNLNFWQRK